MSVTPDEIMGEFQAPAGTTHLNGSCVVPEIPKENGTSWVREQPNTTALVFQIPDGTQQPNLVYMSENDRNRLKDYSHSMPTGVYPGKMWKCRWTNLDGSWDWHLMWYGIVPDKPNVCSINHCPIMLYEILRLIKTK